MLGAFIELDCVRQFNLSFKTIVPVSLFYMRYH